MLIFLTSITIVSLSARDCFAQTTVNVTVGSIDVEPKQTGEFELPDADKREASFIEGITKDVLRPEKPFFTDIEISQLQNDFKAGNFYYVTENQTKGDTTVLPAFDSRTAIIPDFNSIPFVFYGPSQWNPAVYDCCPRSQSYQCRSNSQWVQLPCRFNWLYGWCCPVTKVLIRTNNCKNCFRLCSDCVVPGKCLPRYRYQWYLAVCWNWWGVRLAIFRTYLPTSYYCQTNTRCLNEFPTISADPLPNPITGTQ